jgi:putative addiction module component (TIGR02574 family)
MTQRAKAVLGDALALPLDERASVAAELLASLDNSPPGNPQEVEAAWAVEVERRARRVLAGESRGEPWDTVRERTARKLTDR